jgi:tRNA A-37 threonylcarbamoyl transferase component Bud32
MNYNFLNCSHNKIFKRNKFVYKFFKSDKKYKIEKEFYLNTRNYFCFIPKLYCFHDKRRLLILQSCGEKITKNEFIEDLDFFKLLHHLIVLKSGYFHRDLYYKNIVKNNKNQYFIIDFESCSKENKNIHKRSKEFYIN